MSITLQEVSKEWMKDEKFVQEYNALEQQYSIVRALIKARTQAGLSQAELAKRMGISQPAIARIESGKNISVNTISKYAIATGQCIQLTFSPTLVHSPLH